MEAEKIIIETDKNGCIKTPLHLAPNTRFEAILLTLNKKNRTRKASAKIAGKGEIMGNILNPIIPIEDWDALQ